MGIVRTVLISTIDLRYPKSLCKNLSLRKFKKLKFQYFPLYFWVYSLVKIKVQFWEGRWPRIKKFRKRKLLSTKFYRRKHLSQIRIWFWQTLSRSPKSKSKSGLTTGFSLKSDSKFGSYVCFCKILCWAIFVFKIFWFEAIFLPKIALLRLQGNTPKNTKEILEF